VRALSMAECAFKERAPVGGAPTENMIPWI